MQWLFNEFGTGIGIIIFLISLLLTLYVVFIIIKAAVRDGTADNRRLLERQNEILKELLNKK